MRKIKEYKLFEKKEENTFFIDCTHAFIDFIDDGAEYEIEDDNFDIWIEFKCVDKGVYNDIDILCNKYNKNMELLKDIKSSINKLEDTYSVVYNIEFDVNHDDDDIAFITICKSSDIEVGDFWTLGKDKKTLKIIKNKAVEYFDIPNSTDISASSTGSDTMISFYFKSPEELDTYSQKLIDEFTSVKIDGEPLVGDFTLYYSTSEGNVRREYEIKRNHKTTYHSSKGQTTEIENKVIFGVNKKFDCWF